MQVGPHVFDDADTFRGAFDDFVPEGAATPGDLRLLVDAISTGAFQRLVQQLELNADPPTAIAAEAERLARDRGTVETEGARWALSVLAFARGLTEEPGRRYPALRPWPTLRSRTCSRTRRGPSHPLPPNGPDDVPPTFVPPDRRPPRSRPGRRPRRPPGRLPPAPAAEPPKKRGRLPLILAAAVVIVIAVVAGVVLLDWFRGRPGRRRARRAPRRPVRPAAPRARTAAASTPRRSPRPRPTCPRSPRDSPTPSSSPSACRPRSSRTCRTTFGEGTATEVFGGGDPTNPDVQAVTGPEPTAARVRELVGAGIPVRLKYYVLRQVGQGGGDASGQALLDLMADDDLMATYWTSVRDMLTALDGVGGPVEMVIEPDLPSEILSEGVRRMPVPFLPPWRLPGSRASTACPTPSPAGPRLGWPCATNWPPSAHRSHRLAVADRGRLPA